MSRARRDPARPIGTPLAWLRTRARRLVSPALRLALCWTLGLACAEGPPDEQASAVREEGAPSEAAWLAADEPAPGKHGRFRKRRAPAHSEAEQAEMERLAAIGYLEGSREAHAVEGVVRYDRERAAPGLNLYSSGHGPEALLMDMEGRILHRWSRASRDVWSGKRLSRPGATYFRRAFLLEDGELLVIFEGIGIVKLDADSNVLWARPEEGTGEPAGHHDIEVQPNGDLLTLTRKPRVIEWMGSGKPVLEDYVTVYDRDGNTRLQVSLAEAFARGPHRDLVFRGRHRTGDVFHTNSVHRLDGSVAHVNRDFDPGNVLLSIRHLDALAVLDPRTRTVVWVGQGDFKLQHDAEILANGSLLLFDNGTAKRRRSRAVELDPGTLEVRWSYDGSDADPLWSKSCGTVQRLENGNTLITESDNGRALEVTPAGDVVWEFRSPHRAGSDDELVATLFDVIRLPADLPIAWADPGASP